MTQANNTSDNSKVTEATVLQKVLDVAEDSDKFEVLDYEVDRMHHRQGYVEVAVDMAIREWDGVGLEQLTDNEDDIEVRIGAKGGGSPFASITISGHCYLHDLDG